MNDISKGRTVQYPVETAAISFSCLWFAWILFSNGIPFPYELVNIRSKDCNRCLKLSLVLMRYSVCVLIMWSVMSPDDMKKHLKYYALFIQFVILHFCLGSFHFHEIDPFRVHNIWLELHVTVKASDFYLYWYHFKCKKQKHKKIGS